MTKQMNFILYRSPRRTRGHAIQRPQSTVVYQKTLVPVEPISSILPGTSPHRYTASCQIFKLGMALSNRLTSYLFERLSMGYRSQYSDTL